MNMHTGEVWQLYASDGEPLVGQGLPSGTENSPNHSFGIALVWLWRIHEGALEVCLQKRAKTKKNYPGMYSTSAGGHINLGESPQEAAVRECQEEIGVALDPSRLSFIGAFRVSAEASNVRFAFSHQVEGDIEFHFHDGEVEAVEWMTHDEFMRRIEDPNSDIVMRKYGLEYTHLMMDHVVREAEKAQKGVAPDANK